MGRFENHDFSNHENEFFDDLVEQTKMSFISMMKTSIDIGDRVKVFDFSSLSHENGETPALDEFNTILTPSTMFIVIDVRRKNLYHSGLVVYPQDIVIVEPKTKKKYRVGSYHVNYAPKECTIS